MSHPSASLIRAVSLGLLMGWCAAIASTLVAWVLPVEIVQSWAVDRAGSDDFARFEAFEASAAALWCVRWIVSTLAVVLFVMWLKRRRSGGWLIQVCAEFWQAMSPFHERVGTRSWRTAASRLFIVAWLMLATYHAGASVLRRLWDWPLYRLYSGQTILPNISDNNREVIRYLEASTPPGSRILVLSDQKLFFLSYYLLPRRLYHPMHPEAEFVIPQPYNQRQLAAYRLKDLDPDRVQKLRPDYILEYFEGTPYIRDRDLAEDSNWVNFERRRNAAWRPQYLVSLRAVKGGTP